MVVAALLLSLAVPSFADWLARHRLQAAAQHLVADLGEARHEAVRLGRPLHVVFRTGSDWCYAIALDAQADCRRPGHPVLKSANARQHPGVTLLDAAPLAFDGRSGVRSGVRSDVRSGALNGAQPGVALGAHLVSARGDQLMVQVSALGRPTLCAPARAALKRACS